MTRRFRRNIAATLIAPVSVAVSAWCVVAALLAPAASAATPLNGVFTLTAGSCASGSVSGTYLRMILPSGTPSGPYMSNSDSRCADQTYTPLAAGTDGGLISGGYQPTPQPPFDTHGNALAGRITAPSPFYGTAFATSSNPKDPQTGVNVPAPQVYANGSSLTADLRAFSVTWNGQYFNQGAPKPDGSLPGNTRPATGTYDPSTGAFTLSWTSQVVGGPFDKFTGQWHLAGQFTPTRSATSAAGGAQAAPGGPAGSAGQGGGPPAAAGNGVAPAGGGVAAVGTPKTAHGGVAAAGSKPSAAAAVPVSDQQLASTNTTTSEKWSVRWPVIVLASVLALAGFVTIALLNNRLSRGTSP